MKNNVKALVNVIFILLVFPLALLHLLSSKIFHSDAGFVVSTQALSLIPGSLGNYARKSFLKLSLTYGSLDCSIGFATLFSQSNTEIHKGVYIGPQCNIGSCRIEKNCLLGSGVHVLSGKGQHNFDDLDTPIQEQGGHYEKITIGEDTWIGNGAILMANIGRKCVVGAGSVVIKDIPDYSIVGGNPARILKNRQA